MTEVRVSQDGLADNVTQLYRDDRAKRWTTAVEQRVNRDLEEDQEQIRQRFLALLAEHLPEDLT